MNKNESVEINLCAVWEYDGFPGFLVGLATELNRNGTVYVPTYQGSVKPLILLPPDQARHLDIQVKRLVDIEKEKLAEVEDYMKGLRNDSLPACLMALLK